MALNDYITVQDVEDRLSAQVVLSIYDDENSGQPTDAAVVRLIKDACSMVNGYLFTMYSQQMNSAAWTQPYPEEVVRLTLDCVEAIAAKRHPEAVKRDWQPLMKCVKDELDNLRKGVTRLNFPNAIPEPAANSGAGFHNGNSNPIGPCVRRTFVDGTGDF